MKGKRFNKHLDENHALEVNKVNELVFNLKQLPTAFGNFEKNKSFKHLKY